MNSLTNATTTKSTRPSIPHPVATMMPTVLPTATSTKKFDTKSFEAKMNAISTRVSTELNRISRAIGRWFLLCIVLFVAAYFCPELRERIPSFYIFVDGTLQLMEWAYHKAYEILVSLASMF